LLPVVEGAFRIVVWGWRVDLRHPRGIFGTTAVKLEIVVVAIVLMTGECAAAQTAPLPRPRPSASSSETTGVPGATPRNTACQLRLTPDRAVFRPSNLIAAGNSRRVVNGLDSGPTLARGPELPSPRGAKSATNRCLVS
jgi:hypothetical protein